MVERSPDIVVRAAPDIDPAAATLTGLDTYASDPVIIGQPAYVYVQVNNTGPAPLPAASIRLLAADAFSPRGLALGPMPYPERWREDELATLAPDGSAGAPVSRLALPEIAPGGRAVVGPLVWQPDRVTTGCMDEIALMGRLISAEDPIDTDAGDGREQAIASNNIALTRVNFVTADCVPGADRFERNDRLADAALVDLTWEFLKDRCPRRPAIPGTPYPNAICAGIFEDGVTPRHAEQIWTLELGDLTLHSPGDADFYDIALPDLTDPAYGLDDINTEEIRTRFGGLPGYAPEPMPECGAVQRTDPGPGGALSRSVWVNVATRLTVEIVTEGAPENALATRPVGPTGEALRIYPRGPDPAPTITSPYDFGARVFHATIECPSSELGLPAILMSFGEREDVRAFTSMGGYRIRLTYRSEISRTTPGWAHDPGITGEGRGLGCLGPRGAPGLPSGIGLGSFSNAFALPPGLNFPFCPALDPGLIGGLIEVPDLVGCIADGPGCWHEEWFYWPGGQFDFGAVLLGPESLVSLVDAGGETLVETELTPDLPPMQIPIVSPDLARGLGAQAAAYLLAGQPLDAGLYALRFEGGQGGLFATLMPDPAMTQQTPMQQQLQSVQRP